MVRDCLRASTVADIDVVNAVGVENEQACVAWNGVTAKNAAMVELDAKTQRFEGDGREVTARPLLKNGNISNKYASPSKAARTCIR